MGTEVAVESDPRLAGPGTVRAWEESGIAGSISRRLSSFPGLLDLCAAPLLECVHGVSGEGLPSSPVMSAGLKLLRVDFCMAYTGLYAVFESLERPALLSPHNTHEIKERKQGDRDNEHKTDTQSRKGIH